MAGLNIAFACDSNYLPHLATAVTSLLENNPEGISRVFHVTDSADSDGYKTFVDYIASTYSLEIETLLFSTRLLTGQFVSGRFTLGTYYKFLLEELLPQDLNNVLYLDSDLLVLSSLHELSDLIPPNSSDDQGPLPIVWAVNRDSPEHLLEFGHSGDGYFNSGVMLIDLALWRRMEVTKTLLAVGKELYGRTLLLDQDVLNLVLDGHWSELPGTYNETRGLNGDLNATILHFVGGNKPWMFGSASEIRKKYNSYRRLTPFFPYAREGLGKYIFKLLVPRSLRKPKKLVRRFSRRLKRYVSAMAISLVGPRRP